MMLPEGSVLQVTQPAGARRSRSSQENCVTLTLHFADPEAWLKMSLAPGCDWSFTVKIMCWPVRVPQRVPGTTFVETASIPLTIIVSFWHVPFLVLPFQHLRTQA